MTIKININKKLSFDTSNRPLIIAEISGNHNQNKSKFLDHIKSAHKNGADLIKIQTYQPEDITLKSKNKNFYIKSGIWKKKNLWDIYKQACTPYSWHYDAFKLAKKIGATLFSTPFSERAVDFLEKFDVPIYKLASLEITDLNLVKKIAKTKKPMIISTGLSSHKEILTCVNLVKQFHKKIILLHCVSEYPTDNKNADISRIIKIKKSFKSNFVGLSDHTNDIYSSLAAIPLKIVAIEKHYKTSKKLVSLDSSFSICPEQLRVLKKFSVKINESLKPSAKKTIIKKNLRRSIYAKKDIKKGEKLTSNNIISLRPRIGICSSNYFKILKKITNRNIKSNTPIFKNYLK